MIQKFITIKETKRNQMSLLVIYFHGKRVFQLKIELIDYGKNLNSKFVQLDASQKRVLFVHLVCCVRLAQQHEPISQKRVPS